MLELVYIGVLEASAVRIVGSSPTEPTRRRPTEVVQKPNWVVLMKLKCTPAFLLQNVGTAKFLANLSLTVFVAVNIRRKP